MSEASAGVSRVDEVERALEARILDLLGERAPGATICPSEAARAVHRERSDVDDRDEGWRELMEPARRAASRLAAAGEVVVTQRGTEVDVETARGPIRVRRPG